MKTILFSNFRISEFIQFFKSLVGLCNKNNPAELGIIVQVNKMDDENKSMESSFKRAQKSKYTQKLIELDQQRDNMIVGIRTIAEGFTYHFDEKLKQAGKAIVETIDRYGTKISKLNYKAETSTLDNIYTDFLNSKELTKALTITNTKAMMDKMITANQEFEEVFEKRIQDDAADDSKSSGELVKQAIVAYRTLIKHIEAHATIKPGEGYNKLIREINELIDSYNETMEKRTPSSDVEEDNQSESGE